MATTKLERKFQRDLIIELKAMFPGCLVMKLDTAYIQGIPDLLILYRGKWATLECKRDATAHVQPNQAHYVEMLNKMSFSRFIYPENKEEVLIDLQQAFRPCGRACFLGCEQVPLDQLRRGNNRQKLSRIPDNSERNHLTRFRGSMYTSESEASSCEEDSEYVCE